MLLVDVGPNFVDTRPSVPTIIANLDPRLRLSLALVWAMIMAVLNQLQALAFAWFISLFFLCLAKPNFKITIKRILGVNFFLLLIWLFTPFTLPGSPFFTLGPLVASVEGVRLAFIVTIKANALICLFLATFNKLSPSVFAYALQSLYIPQSFVLVILFTHHSLQILQRQWQSLNNAIKLRAFKPRFNWHTYKTIATLLGTLLLYSFEHAKDAYDALLLRNFSGTFFPPKKFSLQKYDFIFLFIGILVMIIMLYLELF